MRVGNAPVSWGVYEAEGPNPPYGEVLDGIARAGYDGTELGPYGYLPTDPATLARELAARSLALGSSFVPLPLDDPERRGASVERALVVARLLASQGVRELIVADDEDPERAKVAGRVPADGSSGWDGRAWREAAATLHAVGRAVGGRLGVRVVVHHHAGTFVETEAEIDRLLAETEADLVGLLVDTGHCVYGGGDPVALVRRHGPRVRYVHLKDARTEELEYVRRTSVPMAEAWARGVFCPLGEGVGEASPLVDGHRDGFPEGFTAITHEGEPGGNTGMDFGIWRLGRGASHEERAGKETAWVLLHGEAALEWDEGSGGGRAVLARRSLFDEAPAVLHVPTGTSVHMTALAGAEWAVARAANERSFAPRLFRPEEVAPEYRGQGLVQGACLRNVRLVFDDAIRPEANLVLGEVVNYPGRWSSYPPHTHAQPEIYHYRFTRREGWGHAELGDAVFKVKSGDTLKITGGATHAQVSAPGYGMYYLWVVRHLPGNRYSGFTFEEAHRWVLDPAQQGWEPPA